MELTAGMTPMSNFSSPSSGHKAAGGLQLSEQIASYENTLLRPVTKSVTKIS